MLLSTGASVGVSDCGSEVGEVVLLVSESESVPEETGAEELAALLAPLLEGLVMPLSLSSWMPEI